MSQLKNLKTESEESVESLPIYGEKSEESGCSNPSARLLQIIEHFSSASLLEPT